MVKIAKMAAKDDPPVSFNHSVAEINKCFSVVEKLLGGGGVEW